MFGKLQLFIKSFIYFLSSVFLTSSTNNIEQSANLLVEKRLLLKVYFVVLVQRMYTFCLWVFNQKIHVTAGISDLKTVINFYFLSWVVYFPFNSMIYTLEVTAGKISYVLSSSFDINQSLEKKISRVMKQ